MKKADHKYAVLLAGGSGTRFWPQSRKLKPKQFLSFYNKKSLFEETILRIKKLIPAENIYVATNKFYRDQTIKCTKQFGIPITNIICEPSGKNTAPCIAAVVHLIDLHDPEARICVLPCDHLIKDNLKFIELLRVALDNCADNLVIFGVPPYRPAIGYGYIKVKGVKLKAKNIYQVDKFLEKPDLKTAKRFIKDNGYFWNSGMFVGSSSKFIAEFKICLPELYKLLSKVKKASDINKVWNKIEPISFDYGVMEKSSQVLMIPTGDIGWSDLGSWKAFDEIIDKNAQGNSFKADVIDLGSKNITVLGNKRLIATIGLKDLIIVDTPDALLVAKKDKSEEVKNIVDNLKRYNRREI